MDKTNGRNSSIELLRLLAMMMILCLHADKDMMLSNNFEMSVINNGLMHIIESLSLVAVNCFILITGYFSIDSNRLKVRKAFDIIFVTIFYGIAIYGVMLISGLEAFSLKQAIKCAVPFLFDKVWFINIYLILYLLIPFINKALKGLTKKQYTALIIILLLLFSVWPSFLPNPPSNDSGYGIITFILIYSIGGYLKLHYKAIKNPFVHLIIYIIASAITCVLFMFADGNWLNYNSIFIIIASVALFAFFNSFSFNSKAVNYIAPSTLSIFIIHAHQCIRPNLFVEYYKLQEHLASNSYIVYYLVCVISIFVLCVIIDVIRRFIFKYTFDKLFDKIKLINKSYVI